MKVIDPGHYYLLDVLDKLHGVKDSMELVFVKREGPGYPGNIGHHSGTTLQEVIRALIDRTQYLNQQIACAETEAVHRLLQSALLLLEIRAKRVKRKSLDAETLYDVINGATCPKCMHVQCTEDHSAPRV